MTRMNRMVLSFLTCTASLWSLPAWAVDSYRYLHVTIDTPWAIFLFLLPIVLSPFILMAFLYWRFAGRPKGKVPLTQLESSESGSGRS